MTLKAKLDRWLGEAGTEGFPPGWFERVEALDDLLEKWSGRISLSGLSGEEQRGQRYFAEALAAKKYVPLRGTALDIGTGAGSPALPLAIVTPGLEWVLLESRRLKAGFLREAVRTLCLENVRVETRRFDDSWGGAGYGVVTTRGIKLRGEILENVESRLADGGRHLWFSSESILKDAARRLGERAALRVEGPMRLLAAANVKSGWLLVCERVRETGCFT
ncbi:MAG TPA: RsmG family class I SAM-dependent methyltransferase [Vicinamibacteria bacterium]|nr:RsmG family class I SAM-dependent methyltransferase [Vicinamibacteria bacterium]